MGRVWKFGDNISTDHIIPGRYYHLRSNLTELAKHVMEDAHPEFAKKVKHGDFIVGGKNFGMGSSREHAPLVIKMAGISAVIAKSFARIFYRNSINIGVPLFTANTDEFEDGDVIELDVENAKIKNLTKNFEIELNSIPEFMRRILERDGILNYLKEVDDLEGT